MAAQSITEQVAILKAAGLSISDIDSRAGVWTRGSDESGWIVSGKADLAAVDALVAEVTRTATQPAARTQRQRTTHCEHTDIDNNGICYACGAYVRGADAGRTLRRYGITR